jgi:hypothetical protein
MKRSVSFCEEQNQVLEFFKHDDDLVNDIWYSAEYYVAQKSSCREEARQRRLQGYDALLEEAWRDEGCDDAMIQECLNDFCKRSFLRGLERRGLSQQLQAARSDCKSRARLAVLMYHSMGMSEERIATVYRTLGEEAVVFAQRLGIADEFAVWQSEDQENQDPAATVDVIMKTENKNDLMIASKRRISFRSVLSFLDPSPDATQHGCSPPSNSPSQHEDRSIFCARIA